LASGAGPRTTGSAIEVATVIEPLASSTEESATCPSSHGRPNTKWSFAVSHRIPIAFARRT
jgi:hypothetical protein